MEVREALAADWEAIWPFFREIVAAGETTPTTPRWTRRQARAMWMVGPPGGDDRRHRGRPRDRDRQRLREPRRARARTSPAPASWSIPRHAGRGIGRALGEWVIEWATRQGFRAIQFNAVVETNERAVGALAVTGLRVIGTVPEAFRLPDGRYVGLHVMYRAL